MESVGAKPWKRYEQQIVELLRAKADPSARVEPDVRLPGRLSGTQRQVDVLVTGKFAGLAEGLLAVDCKCWSERVDVSDVDRFIGLIEDVGVSMGLLITNLGFSKAAQQRAASARGIWVWVVPFDELPAWEPSLTFCEECRDARPEDSFPGVIEWEPADDVDGALGIGTCDRCTTPHIRCTCDAITALPADGDWPCDGCGAVWLLETQQYDQEHVDTGTLSNRIRRQSAEE